MPNICSIYYISNFLNEKVYVGQTWVGLNIRFNQHKSKSSCLKLKNAMNKYGNDNFAITLLTTTDNQVTADYLEKFWINTFDSINKGYNIKEGGSHGRHSNETKLKISTSKKGQVSRLGMKHSDDTKKKISQAQKRIRTGRKHSLETIQKMKEALAKRAPMSEETKKKISQTLKNKKVTNV